MKKVRGFTLVEVMLALLVLSIVLFPIVSSIIHGLNSAKLAKLKTIGLYTAQMRIEELGGWSLQEIVEKNGADNQEIYGMYSAYEAATVEKLPLVEVTVSVYSEDDLLLSTLTRLIKYEE